MLFFLIGFYVKVEERRVIASCAYLTSKLASLNKSKNGINKCYQLATSELLLVRSILLDS